MCQACKTGHHPFTQLRRRLNDEAFERLLQARDAAKAARAADAAIGAALMGGRDRCLLNAGHHIKFRRMSTEISQLDEKGACMRICTS